MKLKSSVQWWPDRANLKRFIEVDDETIKTGLADAVESRLGEIAGRTLSDDFYRNREALVLVINCMLRLPNKKEFQPSLENRKKTVHLPASSASLSDENGLIEIDVYDLNALFKAEGEDLKEMLSSAVAEEERSEIEKLYGIQIKAFFLDDVNFTEETRKALETKRQKSLQMQGATEVLDWKRKQAKAFTETEEGGLGLDPKDAIDTVDITVEQVITEKDQKPRVKKKVISFGAIDKAIDALRKLKGS
jgi:hypothetical protein